MVGLIEPKNVNSLDFTVSTSKMTIADQGEALREISSFGERLSLSKLPYKKVTLTRYVYHIINMII